jgi:hypothetical protein
MCGAGVRWCARADAIFDVPGMHVLDVGDDRDGRLIVTVESDQVETGCPSCGVIAASHGRRPRMLHDAPCLGRVTMVRWLKRMWRCREPACPIGVFSETHDIAPPRAVLTVRAVGWAADALAHDDATVSALARHLGVDWHTAWNAIEIEAKVRTGDPTRLTGVKTIGVDEHIWRPSRVGVDRAVTIMVDLSRDQAGCLHARLLDAVVGRSGSVYKAWLKTNPRSSSMASTTPPWTRSAAMPTRFMTASLTRWRCSMPSMWCGSGLRWSMRSGVGCSKTAWAAAATNTTRCIRSVGSSATV